jgi:hypothetical protein
MSCIQDVRNLVSQFLENSRYVNINKGCCAAIGKKVAKVVRENALPKCGEPSCLTDKNGKPDLQKIFEYELIANSINYCYWLGDHSIRPKDASSGKMYNLLTDCWEEMNKLSKSTRYPSTQQTKIIIEKFIGKLSGERFPLLEHRVRHLKEIEMYHYPGSIDNQINVEDMLSYLINLYPGYAADPFLKRAFLLIIQLNRTTGLFENEIKDVPVPADYQVPKMLRWHQCIQYLGELEHCVDNMIHIPEGSRMELELRAATIRACDYIAKEANCSPAQVDSYLWGNRKDCNHPFHLTITTNY